MGDAGHQVHNAELHGHNTLFTIYGSNDDKGRESGIIFEKNQFYTKRLTLIVENEQVVWNNYAGSWNIRSFVRSFIHSPLVQSEDRFDGQPEIAGQMQQLTKLIILVCLGDAWKVLSCMVWPVYSWWPLDSFFSPCPSRCRLLHSEGRSWNVVSGHMNKQILLYLHYCQRRVTGGQCFSNLEMGMDPKDSSKSSP